MQGYLASVSEVPNIEFLPKLHSQQPVIHLLHSDSPAEEASSVIEKTATDQEGKKPSALVVDDAPDLAEMLAVFLTHAGYEVVTAESAKAAIAAAQVTRFDVIISDIGMPLMNGYQLAQALREMPDYASVPMIAVSGFSMYDDQERSLSSGFNAHINKPIDPVGLFEIIEQLRG
jgi:two-component system CheB/CheR fusion protein